MSRKKIVLALSIFLLFILILTFPSKENIPCLMFHHVLPNTRVNPKAFEQILIWLKKEGYKSIFISDLLKYKNKKLKLPSKTIILTFDDGYVDNYIYALPLLKKYGFKATISIITSKISSKPQNGYLSWVQLKEMIQSKFIQIQSHSHTHSYCYVSDKITTFNSPSSLWHVKEYSLDGDKRFGIPIYERKSSLIGKCYCDDHNLRNYLAEYVAEYGGKNFFTQNSEWQNILFKLAKNYMSKNGLQGHYESSSEYEKRVIHELLISKNIIEKKLNTPCIAIIWPWGQYTERLISIATGVGYKICVTADRGTNYIGEIDLQKIKRIEAKEYGINKLILGKLPLAYSINIRLFLYRHYLLGYIYNLMDKTIDWIK